MSFPRYPKYRDSGVELLGEVPRHWDVVRLKDVLDRRITDGPHTTPEFVAEGVPFLSVDGIQDGELQFDACRYVSSADHALYRVKALPQRDDLLMGKAASTGKIARVKVDLEFSIWSPLALIRLNRELADPAFYEHSLKSPIVQAQIDNFCTANTQKNISMEDIPRLIVTRPPFAEQTRIATFLDQETAKIARLVAEQQRLIELLKEKRQAVISHAVTKGLNPDAPLKPSGIEWVADAPAHWRSVRNKLVFEEIDDRSPSGDSELMTVSHLTGVTPRSAKDVNMFLAETLEGYKVCRRGDLVINTMWAWMGALGCSPCDGLVSPSYNVYRPRAGQLVPAFYDYLCRIPSHRVAIKANSTGVWESRLRLYPNAFLDMRLSLPPGEEQLAIASYLDSLTLKWADLVGEAERAIGLLQERRSALISAAVTGQIDVRGLDESDVA